MATTLKDTQVSVRLPNELKDKMEAYAELTGRTWMCSVESDTPGIRIDDTTEPSGCWVVGGFRSTSRKSPGVTGVCPV